MIPATRDANLVIWAILGLTLTGWQVAALASRGRMPSVGVFVRLLMGFWPTRWFLLAGWVWLGWHTFVRGSWQ